MEVKLAPRCVFWRPGIELHPLVAARLKKKSFFERQATFVLEPVSEPRRFDFLAEIERGVAAKRNRAERFARAAPPAAVIPRARYEIVQMIGIIFFEEFIDLHRPVEIFLVPPAGDV